MRLSPGPFIAVTGTRRHPAGMEGVTRHSRPRDPSRQLVGEEQIGKLGATVGPPTAVAPFPLEIVEIQPGVAVCAPKTGQAPDQKAVRKRVILSI